MSEERQMPIQSPQQTTNTSHKACNIQNDQKECLNQIIDPERTLQRIKSSEELQTDFKKNQQILASLNSNIDELFKKISQLTEQVSFQHSKSCVQSQEYIRNSSPNIQIGLSENQTKGNKNHDFQQQLVTVNENFILGLHLDSQFQHLGIKDFQTGKTLGYGKFGQVLQCKHLKTGTLYALKKILKSTISQYKMQDQLVTQIQAQKRMDHPNIVKTFKSFTDPYHFFILMEFVDGVQLTKKFRSSQQAVSRIIRQILQAIKQMHAKKIVHRDLKPENIIINQINGQVKITDFGWASVDSQNLNIMCGTLDYLSPEMAQNKQYDEKVDLWSIGVLTYELIYGKVPFKDSSKKKTMENIKNIRLEFPEFEGDKSQGNQSQYTKCSQQCKDFVKGFLTEAEKRKDLNWALSHQFITKHVEIMENEISDDIYSLF